MFELSQRSLDRLQGVDERLVKIVSRAIQITDTDFGVIQGLRTEEEQKALVEKGASKTMKSKHLDGLAVDLMAYIVEDHGNLMFMTTLQKLCNKPLRKKA